MVELGLFFGSVLSWLYKSVSVSMFVQMNTHDCFVSIVKLPVCASVSQEQRSSCEEPGRCPNSGPHLCHICLPVPSRCVNLPPWHLFTCGTTLHLTGRRASALPPPLILFLKASVTHLSFLSLTPGFLLPSCTSLSESGKGNHRSENGDHFVPVPGLAAAKYDTSGRCGLTAASR